MYPQCMFCQSENKKNSIFSTENFQFLQLRKTLYISWANFCNDDFDLIANTNNWIGP